MKRTEKTHWITTLAVRSNDCLQWKSTEVEKPGNYTFGDDLDLKV